MSFQGDESVCQAPKIHRRGAPKACGKKPAVRSEIQDGGLAVILLRVNRLRGKPSVVSQVIESYFVVRLARRLPIPVWREFANGAGQKILGDGYLLDQVEIWHITKPLSWRQCWSAS